VGPLPEATRSARDNRDAANREDADAVRSERSYCRVCAGLCGMVLTVDDAERITSIRGDRNHPLSRRMYRHLPSVRHRVPYNPASVHPEDLDAMGLTDGDAVYVVSEHGRIRAVVRADATMRRAVIAMSHGWGELPREDATYERVGSCTSMLISSRDDLEPINAMPRQSAIPVWLEPALAD
jgi:anaerobic selenocysteine-containing dehydrogenase